MTNTHMQTVRVEVPVPEFDTNEAPKDALKRALAYLQAATPDVALIKSRQALRHSRGALSMEFSFHGSTWSRRGIGCWCHFSTQVHDAALAAWRKANPDHAIRTGDFLAGFVTNTANDFCLYGSRERAAHVESYVPLEKLPKRLETFFPRLDCYESPARPKADLEPRYEPSPEVYMEWAVSRDDRDLALSILQRRLGANEEFRTIVDRARRGHIEEDELWRVQGQPWFHLAKAITRLGLVAPGDDLP